MKKFLVKTRGIIWLCAALILLCTVNNSEALNVTIEWDANAEAVDGYKLYYQADTPGPPFNGTGAAEGDSPIDVGNVTSYSITGLTDGKIYYISLTAYKGTLESGYSNMVNTGTGTSDTTAPTVISVTPLNSSTVAIDTPITALFSEAMDATSISTLTFRLDNGATGTVSYNSQSRTAIYSPPGGLNSNTIYTATITTGAKDTAGNTIASDYAWSFTTAVVPPPPDTEGPSVSSNNPADLATDISVDTTVSVTFSEIVNCGTVTSGTLHLTPHASGSISCFETGAIFTPTESLDYNNTYTVSVTTGITDLAGNAMASNVSWSFTTESDITPPTTVTGLSGTPVSENDIDLSWTASTDNVGVTEYNIFRDGSLVGTSTSTNYSDTGLIAKTTYSYKVSALDSSGNESSRSAQVSVLTLDTTAPTVFSTTTPQDGANNVDINSFITVTFSEPMDTSTITTDTFTLDNGSTGTVTYYALSRTARYSPLSSLKNNTTYTATITTGVKDLSGNPLASDFTWSFSTISSSGTTPPDTTSPSPVTGLLVSVVSETAIDLSWTASTDNVGVIKYNIFRDGSLVGTSTSTNYSDTGLNAKTTYTYQVSASDAAGNESDRSSPVSVPTLDQTAPIVISHIPQNNVSNVNRNIVITVIFSEQMDESTITTDTFSVSVDGNNLPGTVTYSGTTATFMPSDYFEFDQTYRVLISTGITDLAGNAMTNNYSWTFMTGTATDNTPPTIASVSPAAGNTLVPVDVPIVAAFSEPMDPATLTASTFMVNCGEDNIPSSLSYAGTSVTIDHTGLIAGTTCTVLITTEAQDLAGNPLASDYTWSFMTVSSENNPPSQPVLISPAANSRDLKTTVSFTWNKSVDKDGDAITYKLYYGTNLDFQAEDTQTIELASTSPDTSSGNTAYANTFGVGALPGTLLLMGFAVVGALPKRKRDALMIALLITGSLFLSQCGGGGEDSGLANPGTGKTPITGGNTIYYTVTNLQPATTYYWKVVASDSRDQQTESEIRSFTTKALGGKSN